MKVFKFGGASVSNAEGVKNVTQIIQQQGGDQLVIVISAMGKMTNAFENLLKVHRQRKDIKPALKTIKDFHRGIIDELFERNHQVYDAIDHYYIVIEQFLAQNTNNNYNYIYDQMVGYGEMISTTIISHYFTLVNLKHKWLDAHNLLKTDERFRSANVDWEGTKEAVNNQIKASGVYLTQGFIGATSDGTYTTLGREGSDYSAAILSFLLNAESMSIWKDVSGVLNADPKRRKQTQLLERISYREALEMAFYGATVIHPKTIKPLENKEIPLYVRSFVSPNEPGTAIAKGVHIYPETTCYTFKDEQILLSIATKDFSFMIEQNISHVFDLLAQHKIKVNLIQNTATSFTVCVEDLYNQIEDLLHVLSEHYEIVYHSNVQLVTLRHADEESLNYYLDNDSVLLIQHNDFAAQIVLK